MPHYNEHMSEIAKSFLLEETCFRDLSARQRILKKASDLFYQYGIHAVGIDRIIDESGVAKRTFYNHFDSKNTLISEYLKHREVLWSYFLTQATSNEKIDLVERILSIFDVLDTILKNPGFCGCPFQKGMAEFGQMKDVQSIKEQIDSHYQSTFNIVYTLLKKTQVKNPKKVCKTIVSMIEGAVILAYALGDTNLAKTNKEAARILLLNS